MRTAPTWAPWVFEHDFAAMTDLVGWTDWHDVHAARYAPAELTATGLALADGSGTGKASAGPVCAISRSFPPEFGANVNVTVLTEQTDDQIVGPVAYAAPLGHCLPSDAAGAMSLGVQRISFYVRSLDTFGGAGDRDNEELNIASATPPVSAGSAYPAILKSRGTDVQNLNLGVPRSSSFPIAANLQGVAAHGVFVHDVTDTGYAIGHGIARSLTVEGNVDDVIVDLVRPTPTGSAEFATTNPAPELTLSDLGVIDVGDMILLFVGTNSTNPVSTLPASYTATGGAVFSRFIADFRTATPGNVCAVYAHYVTDDADLATVSGTITCAKASGTAGLVAAIAQRWVDVNPNGVTNNSQGNGSSATATAPSMTKTGKNREHVIGILTGTGAPSVNAWGDSFAAIAATGASNPRLHLGHREYDEEAGGTTGAIASTLSASAPNAACQLILEPALPAASGFPVMVSGWYIQNSAQASSNMTTATGTDAVTRDFLTFWGVVGGQRRAYVAVREEDSDLWVINAVTGFPLGLPDSHCAITGELDEEGRFWVVGNMHNDDLTIFHSEPNDFTIWTDRSAHGFGSALATWPLESRVTYPWLARGPAATDPLALHFRTFRGDSSSSYASTQGRNFGALYAKLLNSDTWYNTRTGAVNEPTWDGFSNIGLGGAPHGGLYTGDVLVDENGMLHMCWVWRYASSFEGEPDEATAHEDICYAQSDTPGYTTVQNYLGTNITRPIRRGDSSVVVDTGPTPGPQNEDVDLEFAHMGLAGAVPHILYQIGGAYRHAWQDGAVWQDEATSLPATSAATNRRQVVCWDGEVYSFARNTANDTWELRDLDNNLVQAIDDASDGCQPRYNWPKLRDYGVLQFLDSQITDATGDEEVVATIIEFDMSSL